MQNKLINKRLIYWIVGGVIFLWASSWIGIITYYNEPNNIADRGTFGDMFGFVNSLFSGFALAGIIYSIVLQTEANNIQLNEIKKDHIRRKKEATINYMVKVRPVYNSLNLKLNKILNTDEIDTVTLSQINIDLDLKNDVKEYLGMIEHVSAGVNNNVFDRKILYKMSGSYFIRNFEKYQSYIKHVQKDKPYAYIEFEDLVLSFNKMREMENIIKSDQPD